MTRHPGLRPGDTLRLGGQTHTVAGLDSATVRLADVTGAVTEMPAAGLLADPGLELVTRSRVPIAPQPALERLPLARPPRGLWELPEEGPGEIGAGGFGNVQVNRGETGAVDHARGAAVGDEV